MIRNSMPRGLVCLLLALAPAWAQSGGKITSRQVEGLQAQVEAQPTNRASSERRLEALRKLASACSSRRVKRRLSEDSKEWISDVDDVLEGMDEDAAGMEISWAWVDCALSGICHLLLQVEDEDVEEVESTGYVSAKLQDRVVSALRGRTSDEETFWPLAELLGQMLVAEWERDIDLPRDELHEQLWEIARDGVFPGEGAPTAEDEAACRALDRHIARVLGYLVSTPVPPEIDSGHWQGVLEKLPGQLPGGLDALRADSAAAIALVGEVADYVDDVEGNETWKARILSLVRLGELARDARSRDAEAEVAFAVALDGILRLLIEYARVGAEGAPPPLRFPPGMRRAHALAVAGGAGREPAGIELRVALGSVLALARGDAADEDFPPAELLEPLALVPRDEIAAGLGRLALWSMPPEVVQEQLEGLGAGDTTLAQAPARGAHLAMVIRYILARSRVSIRRTELSLNVADELGALDNRERQRDAAVVIDLFREPASQLARSAQAPGGLVRPPVSDHPLETAILSRLLERMQAPCASVLLRRVLLGAFVARAAWPEGQRASDLLARAGDLLARPAVEPGALELLGRGLARSWEEAHQPPPTEEEPPAVPTPTAPPDEATAVPVPPADPPPEAAATPADADTETAALTDDGPADKGAEAGEGSVPPARTGRERPARRQRGAVLPWLLLLVVVAAFVGQHVLRRRRAAAAPTAPTAPISVPPEPAREPGREPEPVGPAFQVTEVAMQPLQPGTLVALPERFAGTTLLGQGGMGLVYRARDQALDRDVVIKTLHESLSRDEGVRARFLDEARAMAALSHPNIVSVHDVHTGHPSYFIMEHIDGECLRDILDREQTLDEGRALATGLALADALAHAHDQGLIHRDVKPENVMVSNRGRVVLLDFGLVKVLEGAARTSPQHVMGTLGYMSPEQLQAEPVDARSDVYSLGVMLYEMVSGISPSRMTSMRNPLFRPPVPPPDLPGVSTELAAVIDRAMSFHRENRHAGAQEMCEALRGAHRRWLEIEGKRSGERLLRALVKLEHMQDELVLPLRDQLALPGGESVLSQANQPARLRSIATRAGDLSDRISDLESDVLEISETVRRLDASRTIIARIAQGAAGRGFARPRDVARAHAIFRELAAHLDLVIGTYKVDVVAVARDAIGSAVTVDGDESTIVMTMADPESFQADLRQLLQGLAEELVGPGEPPPGIRLRRGSGEVCIDVEWRPPASAEAATRIAGQARGITQLRQLAARHGGVIEEGPPDDTRSFTIRIPE